MRIPNLLLMFLIFAVIFTQAGTAWAQDAPAVQELQGALAPGETDIYLLQGLTKGQTLYAYMENSSGNLDPTLSVV